MIHTHGMRPRKVSEAIETVSPLLSRGRQELATDLPLDELLPDLSVYV